MVKECGGDTVVSHGLSEQQAASLVGGGATLLELVEEARFDLEGDYPAHQLVMFDGGVVLEHHPTEQTPYKLTAESTEAIRKLL